MGIGSNVEAPLIIDDQLTQPKKLSKKPRIIAQVGCSSANINNVSEQLYLPF